MLFLSAIILLLASDGISAQCLVGNDIPSMMDRMSMIFLKEARIDFALDSLKKAALIESNDNIFFSPHSINQALTVAYFGARGTTEQSLKEALRIPEQLSKAEVQRSYGYERSLRQTRSQNTENSYEYNVANKFWITNARKLRECMLDFFGDELEVTDFRTNPANVQTYINNWISNITKGHIHDLLPPGAITADTDLVLTNAVYFKGKWSQRFDPKDSTREIFYSSSTQMSITTFMNQIGNFNYSISEELGAYILELPYVGDEISMFVLLPPFRVLSRQNSEPGTQDNILRLVERLATKKGTQELREIMDNGMTREVNVNLPRFEVEKELPIGQMLHALGAGELLAPSAADLRGFVADGEKSVHLGDAVHRARIEVTEEGTTAAAATALFSFRSSRPNEPVVFNANHPFVYLIYDKHSNTILFTGIFRKPAASNSEPSV